MTGKDRDAQTIECVACNGRGVVTDLGAPNGRAPCLLCFGSGRESAVVHPREPSNVTPRREKRNVTE